MTTLSLHHDEASRGAALIAAGALVATGHFATPAGIVLVAFLMLAVEEDLRRFRIPNRITFPALVAVLLLALGTGGAGGLLSALAGAAAGLGILFVPFALGLLGAGDVKAVMVVAAYFGAGALGSLLACMALAGGGLALGVLLLDGGLPERLRRLRTMLGASLRPGRPQLSPRRGSTVDSRLPFGVAIVFGVALHLSWGIA